MPASSATRVTFRLKRLLKRIIPGPLLAAVRDYRSIGANRRFLYARLRLARLLGLRRDRPKVTHETQRLLFVCYGNIMRSPMAAALLARHVQSSGGAAHIRSAGTHARPGRPAEPRALIAARLHGVSLDDHGATPVTEESMHWANVVFAMDYLNETELVHRFPAAAHKVVLLGAFAQHEHLDASIPDPYDGNEDGLKVCYARLAVAVEHVARQIGSGESLTPRAQ